MKRVEQSNLAHAVTPLHLIWDIFMLEGVKIVFRVGLALLAAEEEELLALKFEGILTSLRNLGARAQLRPKVNVAEAAVAVANRV